MIARDGDHRSDLWIEALDAAQINIREPLGCQLPQFDPAGQLCHLSSCRSCRLTQATHLCFVWRRMHLVECLCRHGFFHSRHPVSQVASPAFQCRWLPPSCLKWVFDINTTVIVSSFRLYLLKIIMFVPFKYECIIFSIFKGLLLMKTQWIFLQPILQKIHSKLYQLTLIRWKVDVFSAFTFCTTIILQNSSKKIFLKLSTFYLRCLIWWNLEKLLLANNFTKY